MPGWPWWLTGPCVLVVCGLFASFLMWNAARAERAAQRREGRA